MNIVITPWFAVAAVLAAILAVLYAKKTGYHKTSTIIGVILLLAVIALISLMFPPAGTIGLAAAGILYWLYFRRLTAGMKADEGEWIYYSDFEADYAAHPEDFSGCYVIITFPQKKSDNNYENYDTAYVGSSSSLRKEVHSVLNNTMLSRVHDDIQNGKHAYIKLVPADQDHINSIQEKLITMYHGVPYLLSFQEVREKKKKS